MRNLACLSWVGFLVGCTAQVPIGEGVGDAASPLDGGGTTDSGSRIAMVDGGGTTDGGATADAGRSESGPIDSGAVLDAPRDTGSSLADAGGGDASDSGMAESGTTCSDLPGYPTTPGIYATIAGSDLQGSYALASGPLCGLFATPGEPFTGDYIAFANDTSPPNQEFWLWSSGVAAPATGTPYPLSAWFELLTPTVNPDSYPPGNFSQPYTYPPSGGPGTCTITYDEVSTTFNCARARFSCTGIVGSSSGQSFDVTNGFVVCGAGGTGP